MSANASATFFALLGFSVIISSVNVPPLSRIKNSFKNVLVKGAVRINYGELTPKEEVRPFLPEISSVRQLSKQSLRQV